MRPLHLVITGFGTYCNKTEINLEQLGTQGLYLITGDTGSGKTTIFDAITYALYGTVNGDNRSVGMIRSTFATPDIPTEVELSFEYRGKIYTVKRNPEYERRSKRGDSVTKQLAEAVLFMPDGSVITGQSKVTTGIEELLGINKEQFSQIVMIAQGEFQKLLMEGTEERQKIFRKIFKTKYYQDLQQRLLDEEKALSGKRRDINNELSIYIKGLSCDASSTLNVELEKAYADELAVLDVIELISKIISEDEKASKNLAEKISAVQKEIDGLNIKISDNQKLQSLNEELKNKRKEFETVKNNKTSADDEFKKQKDRESEKQKDEADLAVLEKELPQYEELENLKEEVSNLKNQITDIEDEKKNLENEKEKYTKEKDEDSKTLKELASAEENYFKCLSEKQLVADRKNDFDELEASLSTCLDDFKKFKKLQNDYIEAQKAAEKADSAYKNLRRIYMDEQAGIIAQTLEEGCPCPVCGSVEHPKPAQMSQGAPSKEELDAAEVQAKDLEKNAFDINTNCSAAKAKYENALQSVKENYKKLTSKEACDDLPELQESLLEEKKSVEQNLKTWNEKLKEEEKRKNQKKEIEEKFPGLEKKINEKTEALQKKGDEYSALQARKDEKEKQAKDLKEKLKYESIEEAQNAVDDLKDQIKTIQEAFEEAQKNRDEAQDSFTRLQGEIAQLENQLKGSEIIDLSEIKEKLNDYKTQHSIATEQKGYVDTRLDKNKGSLKNIKERSQELAHIEKQLAYVSALSKTANGNLSNGKEKIKLETFIQMTYFDRIIAHANKRLMIMSDLQYELVRKKDADDLRIQTGLELDVIDHYNGGIRSVKSLSGGESFQASLALALGLSDEVRLSAGGIKIDTMFIDEGFGTLDSETLQKAFKALSGITEGNRLIGIISHVDLLKEKIDRQIVVKKARTGGSMVQVMV